MSNTIRGEVTLELILVDSRNRARIWSGTFNGSATGEEHQIVLASAFADLANSIRRDETILASKTNYDARSPGPTSMRVASGANTRDVVLAIFDVEDASKQFDAAVTDQLTEYIAARVSGLAGYRVIPRDQVRARLQEQKAEGYKACYEESCQIEIGKALAAEKSLTTKLLRVGDACLMTSTLFDLKTETTERAASAKTPCGATALVGGVDQIMEQLGKPK
jgi:hypothetical protein